MSRRHAVVEEDTMKKVFDAAPAREDAIDFSSAGLYVVGIQIVLGTVACAATSVACCWLLPSAAISAVRTLALTAVIGVLFIRKPLIVGRVRGVHGVFNALRPAVPLYIFVLVVEQLVHTCVSTEDTSPSGTWRRVVFNVTTMFLTLAGFIRSHRPQSESDLPFLVTALSIVTIALLPPPAAVLSGPLCEPASLSTAAERLLRAMLWSSSYAVHVYAAAPTQNSVGELAICVMRAGAASTWVLAVHLYVLPLALVQSVFCAWSRFGTADPSQREEYSALDTTSDGCASEAELGSVYSTATTVHSLGLLGDAKLPRLSPGLGGLEDDPARGHRPLTFSLGSSAVPYSTPSTTMTKERMAELAREL